DLLRRPFRARLIALEHGRPAVDLSPRLALSLAPMIANPQPGRLAAGILLAVGLVPGLCACVADGGSGPGALQIIESGPGQPRLATYDCGQDGAITVEAMQNAVRLVEAEGSSYDLPASPPTQA